MLRKLVFLLFMMWIAVSAAGRKPPPPAQSGVTTFKTTSRLVILDAVVTNEQGKFVDGLGKDDFTVLEDGVKQPVTAFEGPSQHPSNAIGSGDAPITIFLMDELDTAFADLAYACQQLEHYLRAQPPHLKQPAALVVLDNTGLRVVQNYTQDRDLLLHSLKKHFPQYPWKFERSFATECMAQSLVALQQLAAATIGIPGRKNVLWVGEGFPPRNLIADMVDVQEVIENAINRTVNRLLEARITVYPIDPEMMESTLKIVFVDDLGPYGALIPHGTASPFDADISMGQFGPATGGRSFYWRNDIDEVIASSVEDGARYYTLAYVPSNRTDEPKYRRIHVKMRRGLRARTRDGYWTTDAPMTDKMVAVDIWQAAQNTLPYTGLPVALTGRPGLGAAKCTLYIDANALSWQIMDNGDRRAVVRIAVAAFSAKDKMLAHQVVEKASVTPAASFTHLLGQPAAFPIEVPLPANTARVRVVARDESNGHMGAVDLDPERIPRQASMPKQVGGD